LILIINLYAEIMENTQPLPNQQSTEDSAQQQVSQNKSRLFVVIAASIIFTGIITGSVVYFWQKSANEKEISSLRQEITTLKNQVTKVTNIETVTSPTPQPTSSLPMNKLTTKDFSYNNFSLNYPNSWTLMDMSTDENFPLKSKLNSLSEKAIALNKGSLYLIITIDKGTDGEAGGIFFNDTDYNEFISSEDKVVIQNSTFYLNKDYNDISSLIEAHSGPWGWSALSEYVPNKTTQSGKVFKGYENIIKRNGYTYNFIIASNKVGSTNPQLQGEIIDILETIKW